MKRALGVTALGLLFLIGTLIAGVAALSLVSPGSVLEPMWRLDSRGRQGLAAVHPWGAVLLSAASLGCLAAGIGLLQVRNWGRWVAIVVVSLRVAGDVVKVASGAERRAAIGIPIVLGLLVHLNRPRVNAAFDGGGEPASTTQRGRDTPLG